ncbi:MAG: helix-turn-helix domain-containing protein, partial [Bacteroidota bacterium]
EKIYPVNLIGRVVFVSTLEDFFQGHQFQPNQDLEGYLLLFTNEFLISYLEQLEAQKSLQLFNELLGEPRVRLAPSIQPEVAALMARLHREYFEVNDGYSLGIIRSELHILIAQLYRAKSQLYPLIQPRKYLESFIRFQELAEAHVKETTRVQDYAEMMGVSTKTLNTITREMLNKSAKAFLDEICIMQVKRLLIHTPLSIKEIAFAAGFDEPSNFYKYFRRHVAQTPEAFRLSFQ